MTGIFSKADHVFPAMLTAPDAGRLQTGIEIACLIDHPGQEHLGQQGDQPTAADTARLDAADHAEGWFQGGIVDPDILDGAFGGPHAMPYAGTFKGRASRTGTGHQKILRTQQTWMTWSKHSVQM